jgi:hypothetical protein
VKKRRKGWGKVEEEMKGRDRRGEIEGEEGRSKKDGGEEEIG